MKKTLINFYVAAACMVAPVPAGAYVPLPPVPLAPPSEALMPPAKPDFSPSEEAPKADPDMPAQIQPPQPRWGWDI